MCHSSCRWGNFPLSERRSLINVCMTQSRPCTEWADSLDKCLSFPFIMIDIAPRWLTFLFSLSTSASSQFSFIFSLPDRTMFRLQTNSNSNDMNSHRASTESKWKFRRVYFSTLSQAIVWAKSVDYSNEEERQVDDGAAANKWAWKKVDECWDLMTCLVLQRAIDGEHFKIQCQLSRAHWWKNAGQERECKIKIVLE